MSVATVQSSLFVLCTEHLSCYVYFYSCYSLIIETLLLFTCSQLKSATCCSSYNLLGGCSEKHQTSASDFPFGAKVSGVARTRIAPRAELFTSRGTETPKSTTLTLMHYSRLLPCISQLLKLLTSATKCSLTQSMLYGIP